MPPPHPPKNCTMERKRKQEQELFMIATVYPEFTLLYNCTNWIRDVSALLWRLETCFCSFWSSPNYPVFSLKKFSVLVCNLFSTIH